ncbi:MAG: hypothetical protein Q9222_000807 [Ikaeria aurantiellina]
MRSSVITYTFVQSTLLYLTSCAVPLNPVSELQILSSLNVSDLGIPPDFKVEITSDTTTSILDEELFRVAIHMMYDVSGLPITDTWLDRDWNSKVGPSSIRVEHRDFGKGLSQLSTQYIIWGLNHLMLSMYLSRRFCATTAALKWQGTQVGAIHVIKRASSVLSNATQDNTGSLSFAQVDSASNLNTEHLDIEVRISASPPIDRQVIFLTAIKAMGDAAEAGLDQPVRSLSTQGVQQTSWSLVGGVEAFTGILKPSYSRAAVVRTLGVMIEVNNFRNTYVWIKADGRNTAVGGFSQAT